MTVERAGLVRFRFLRSSQLSKASQGTPKCSQQPTEDAVRLSVSQMFPDQRRAPSGGLEDFGGRFDRVRQRWSPGIRPRQCMSEGRAKAIDDDS